MPRSCLPSVRLVIFDLGNVLFPFDHRRILFRLKGHTKLSPIRMVFRYLSSGLGPAFDEGRITGRDFFVKLKELLGLSIDFDKFKRVWNGMFNLDKATAGLVRRLHRRYRIFALSDTNELHFKYLFARYRVFDYIDECILSFREGVRKSDKRIFKIALRRAGVRPSEAVFIDDLEIGRAHV
ncbi:MAG: HAD family phosphatase, partial [Candidatus Omnitrophica bacterium]|nr:HAD family phosphatase [Candidatus Omnitrophota bacterium]